MDKLADLKTRLQVTAATSSSVMSGCFGLGMSRVDERLGKGLSGAALHDVYARAAADSATAQAFSLGLALRAAGGRAIVWVLHDKIEWEAGRLHGPGLHELGLRMEKLVLVRARTVPSLLGAGEEALRDVAIGAVLLSTWGEHKAFSPTAGRRLSLAASVGGTAAISTRMAASPAPSPAESRWSVGSAASRALEGEASGRPTLAVALLRHRNGAPPGEWLMEWDREEECFVEPAPLSGGLVPVPADRPAQASGPLRQAG